MVNNSIEVRLIINLILRLIIVSLFIIGFSSCKKYLDEKSDKSLVVLKTLEDLQGLLDDDVTMNANTPGFGEESADDYFVLLSDYNSFSDNDQEAYTWRLFDYQFQNDWSQNYQAIYPANYCLDNIDKIGRTSQNAIQWDNVKGSALFYRAFRYLNLIWEYGKAYDENTSSSDLGIVLRLNSDPSIKSVRSSVKDSYERVILDTKNSIPYLPVVSQHVMRPSKASAYGLLARAYLSMRKYDSAFKYANLALQIKTEILDYNSSEVDPLSQTPFQPFNNEIIFYTTQSLNHAAKNPFIGLIDTILYNSYLANDLRKQVFFYSNNGYQGFKGNYNSREFYALFTGLATDEMLLIRAEGYARDNPAKINEAINDLNTLVAKRCVTGTFIPFTASNPQEALDIILAERRKELVMRGLRWIDIKRLNKEGSNIIPKRVVDQTYTLPPNDNRYALPLPKDIVDITGIPQN